MIKTSTFLLLSLLVFSSAFSQSRSKQTPVKCGTMQRHEQKLQNNPALKARFTQQQQRLTERSAAGRTSALREVNSNATVIIPVVFHIVLTAPSLVTDAQVLAQLDTLNKSYAGTNGDSVRIPGYFQSLFGKSNIRFCLAKRTPDGDPTTGIERVTTSVGSFTTDDAVKSSLRGGTDSWNTETYLNVWITNVSGGILGYASFPNDGAPLDQGVVIDFRTLPGGAYSEYNGGKTLVHEVGHYFDLLHTWGDDNGSCTGSDLIGDTPNQADATDGCQSGVVTDACSGTGNGIMYQNYMDYSYDLCLVMFTPLQVARMENSLALNRPNLVTSNGCTVPVLRNLDAQLRSISSPQRVCAPSFTPAVIFRNRGTQTITAVTFAARINNGPVTTTTWTGSLATAGIQNVTLNSLAIPPGENTLTVYVTTVNGRPDEELTNDTVRTTVRYFAPVTAVSEGFEEIRFPPLAWDIVNRDRSITWERVAGISKSGLSSVMINNYDYDRIGEPDDLRMPNINLAPGLDSAFLSFEVAAAAYSDLNTPGNNWDTLELLVSTNCGQTYTSLYKKWGSSLVTRPTPDLNPFVPTASEWRRDSVNIGAYIGNSNLLFTFRNITGFENNVYLDDVRLRTVSINPNLRAQGFLVTPSPTTGQIAVQFFPQPEKLQQIQIFNSVGQQVVALSTAGNRRTLYQFSLIGQPAGMYTVRAVFTDRVLIKKILKY